MPAKFKCIALAMSVGTCLLAAPMAQAAKAEDPYRPNSLDKFKEKATDLNGNLATLGGSLYVADPNQSVTFTFLADDDLFRKNYKAYYWRDGVDGTWELLFTEDKFQYYKTLNEPLSFELSATSDQVFFAVEVQYTTYGRDERGFYKFSTGDGSLNETTALSFPDSELYKPHSYVFYDYKAENVALVGFEDTRRFILSDYDDAIFTVSNVRADPIPEPETYAMLLAGLGIIGIVARRRRMYGM